MTTFDKYPTVIVSENEKDVWEGSKHIVKQLKTVALDHNLIAIECYPGIDVKKLYHDVIQPLNADETIYAADLFYNNHTITEMIESNLTEDDVFGTFSPHSLEEFLDDKKVKAVKEKLKSNQKKNIIIYGMGASLFSNESLLIYVDIARWEIQQRLQRGMPNWRTNNQDEQISRKMKRSYFFEWPLADRLKKALLNQVDFWIDGNDIENLKLISKEKYLQGLSQVVSQPFRLVPFFAPGVWGGEWMREKFDLDKDEVNFAWSFNGVPAENSIHLQYGDCKIEIPANNVVFYYPTELLGNKVYGRFGREFPIRFNFLDTIKGQNLSLQVHPTTEYAHEEFGAHYTQDESYYILHAEEDAIVYLGLKENIENEEMIKELEEAEVGNKDFDDEKFINRMRIKKHDHYSIPGGTIHSQGKNSVVLEISSTPNIYTFKLWDWGRVDLDGKPRPIHLHHGLESIQWTRDENWVKEHLSSPNQLIAEGEGWYEEKTGLHELEFIETRRHWFSTIVYHETHDSVNVLNLVEGEEAIVESINGEFEPFVVHYAETFIIPEHIKEYSIRPHGPSEGKTIATIKAFVRV
ncbi:mannose-6-phosphate isomerase [Virgibacillus profundi]|uniref:Mannose-6-phosphate isomerase n=1 Tax=Virgibacillus profundi TaxID=2024555 RepID=A0A2A2IB13_9BACI|nr:class I mannose-6-phosphate isomerase [Virgibacillus profundi]PAV28335.1 mannose-6-phosphate isomerase [Virgibacillus profundi]PXY52303.1 mannose-6-phosphate isomerase [Virgibacillus profundi]